MRESMLLLLFILSCTCRAEESTIGTTISNITENTVSDTTTILSTTGLSSVGTTACNANSSCTPEPTATPTTVSGKNNGTVGTSTTAVPEALTTTTVRPKPVRRKEVIAETCTCDLQKHFCDTNCCCDVDCSFEDKEIFGTCIDEIHYNEDTSFCDYMDYIYVNNTPYKWEVNQNSLFCIVRTNLPKQYTIQNDKPIETLEEAELQRRGKFSWSNLEENVYTPLVSPNNESYTFGSNIWIVRNNRMELFTLPDSFVTNACLIKKNVYFLQNFKTKCIQTQLNDDLNPRRYLDPLMLSSPLNFNISKYEGKFQDCPRNVCLPIQTKICKENFQNCTKYSEKTDFVCSSCTFATQSVKFLLYHNGSKGITEVELYLVVKNITVTETVQLVQEFEVTYLWKNSTLNNSLIFSGNPGYLIGKPLLIGSLLHVFNVTNSTDGNQTVTVTKKILRNSNLFSDNFMVLPSNKLGACVLDNHSYVPVEFGYNLITKCKIFNKIQIGNRNQTCAAIQKEIFRFWPILASNHSGVNRVVGTFGNANVSIPNNWVNILSRKTPMEILNATFGNWTNQNRTLLCGNLTTTLKIGVFHSRVDYKNLNSQEKILGVTFAFEMGDEIKLTASEKTVNFEIGIREEVVFYDITREKVRKFVDPPKFSISLPYDFFYPFIKIENGADTSSRSCVLLVCLCWCVSGFANF